MPPAKTASRTLRRASSGTNLYLSPRVVAESKSNLKEGESLSSVTESLLSEFIKRRAK